MFNKLFRLLGYVHLDEIENEVYDCSYNHLKKVVAGVITNKLEIEVYDTLVGTVISVSILGETMDRFSIEELRPELNKILNDNTPQINNLLGKYKKQEIKDV